MPEVLSLPPNCLIGIALASDVDQGGFPSFSRMMFGTLVQEP